MDRSRVLLLIGILGSLSAVQPLHAEPRFTFNEGEHRCLDSNGEEGLNSFDPETLFKDMRPEASGTRWPSRNAQCTDFSNVKFHKYLGANYSVLVAWDFRGSRFTGAQLLFNFIEGGLFLGSTLPELRIGYGRVTAADIEFDQGDMLMPNEASAATH